MYNSMANTKSAIKNIRKNNARYKHNRTILSRLKTLEKNFLPLLNLRIKTFRQVACLLTYPHLKKQ